MRVERSECGAERSKEIEMISKWTPLPAGFERVGAIGRGVRARGTGEWGVKE